MVDLGTLGGSYSDAVDVNDRGQVVGYSDLANGTAARVLVDGGRGDGGPRHPRRELPARRRRGERTAARSSATVSLADGIAHAFSWTAAGGMVDLGTLGGSSSVATGGERSRAGRRGQRPRETARSTRSRGRRPGGWWTSAPQRELQRRLGGERWRAGRRVQRRSAEDEALSRVLVDGGRGDGGPRHSRREFQPRGRRERSRASRRQQ